MKLTNHEEYGLRCLLRLAEQGPGGSLTIPQLSRVEGMSEAYAAKLLRLLRRSGLVKAARGKIGGYVLARPPGRIMIRDVMSAFSPPLFEGGFCREHTGELEVCIRSGSCSLRGLWQRLQEAVDGVLGRTTLESLLPKGMPFASAIELRAPVRARPEAPGSSARPAHRETAASLAPRETESATPVAVHR